MNFMARELVLGRLARWTLARKASSGKANSVGFLDGLTFAELAALIGERPHKLERFAAAGVIAPHRDGRFAIVASVR